MTGFGQSDELSLENPDEICQVDYFIDKLRECKESVANLGLTLDSLMTRLILPERDQPIFVKLMQEKLGMSLTQEQIATHL